MMKKSSGAYTDWENRRDKLLGLEVFESPIFNEQNPSGAKCLSRRLLNLDRSELIDCGWLRGPTPIAEPKVEVRSTEIPRQALVRSKCSL